MTAAAICTVSCNKPQSQGGDTPEPAGPKYRIAVLSYTDNWWDDAKTLTPETATWWDNWYFTYDKDGRVVDVDRKDAEHPEKHWVFKYEGSDLMISQKSDGKVVMALKLNDKGVCTSITDEWDETAVFEYDETLRNTKITKEGEVRSELTWRDNCLTKYTNVKKGTVRTFTYAKTKNIGGLHAIYSEAVDPPARWLYETGLFGNGPEYLPKTSAVEGDPDNASTLSCTVDSNGYCVLEVKTFPVDGDKTPTEIFKITWEEIK